MNDKPTDYSRRPIVVLGVNHSGTRVVVDILTALGSDSGNCDNQWRENTFFLDIHRELIGAANEQDWTGKIFDLGFVDGLAPDLEKRNAIRRKIHDGLKQAYPHHEAAPWHWKCPTSALFMDFWLETYPDAWYVHIVRDPLDVAQSLISRRQFYTISAARRFYDLMEARIARAAAARHYLQLRYESLPEQLDRLTEFLQFLDASGIDRARKLIREPRLAWKPGRSLKYNLWNFSTAARVSLAKTLRGHQ
jgi:hypothetical protein